MTAPHEQAHGPARPSWHCTACGAEWPCGRRRAELIADSGGSRVTLALQLAPYLGEAIADRPDISAEILYERLLGWVRRALR